jgi:hypothetical protein
LRHGKKNMRKCFLMIDKWHVSLLCLDEPKFTALKS